jgi:hypothetical protein
MFFELVAEAAKAKRCVFKLSMISCQGSERHCLLIALIVRRRGVILCKRRQRGRLQCSPIKAKARDDLRHLMHGLKSVPCNGSNAIAPRFPHDSLDSAGAVI